MSIKKRIEELKKEKNAILLAHYYVSDEVQEIADYVGDSFYLAQKATETDADIIVFCGVSFMGESAAILNPEKKILMPDHQADCAMAHMVDVEKIQEMKEQYDDLAVVCYINSTAEIKTYSDVCVTSSNAVKIVNKLSNKNIFFVPDKNLGGYVAEQIPNKNIILNDGYCPIHNRMSVESLKQIKELHPKANFLVHPECKKELQKEADYIGSTAGIIAFAAKDDADEYIIGTEKGVLFELRKQNPEKTFYTLTCQQICTDMKYITLEQVAVLIDSAKETPIYMQILFAVLMGLRRGEINGLKYSDIDYINRTLTIRRQLGKKPNSKAEDYNPKMLTKQEIPVKTDSGNRVIPIPDVVFEAILEQRKIYEKNRRRRPKSFRDLDYICCSSYGNPRSKGYHTKYYKKLLEENHLPEIRFHQLRTTYTTILLKNDFNIKGIANLLGHSKEIISADIYGDTQQIIEDCLYAIESFIESVLPKIQEDKYFDHSDLDEIEGIFGEYLNAA